MGNVLIMPNCDFSANGIHIGLDIKSSVNFVLGNINGAGSEVVSDKQIRSDAFYLDKATTVNVDWTKYKMYLFDWGSGSFVNYVGEKTKGFTLASGKYYRLVITTIKQDTAIQDVKSFGGYTTLSMVQ